MQVTKLDNKGRVAQTIFEYTGRTVVEVEMVADPAVPGTYALRAELAFSEQNAGPLRATTYHLEFLVVGVALNRLKPSDLEEVIYKQWPPTSKDRVTSFKVVR